MLYLEQPAGVGFSYTDVVDPKPYYDDETSAKYNLEALQKFFELFSEYKDNEFHITGESYAGIYIPYLAHEILTKDETKINLKGIMIINGCTNWTLDTNLAF